ncbi:winged helix-turn-helix domain-containing protein [Methanosarcina sp. KYL-1]|nr:winged helix-turn-helix domain-containing protein [Methanosarcina sp. KYL-1]
MKSGAGIRVDTKSSLLDTIFLSDKRKNILLLLKEDGPKSSEEIKEAFDFPWKSMIPQIRKLIDWGLVVEDDGVYALSGMGTVITTNAQFLLDTLLIYEENRDFWSEHDLSPIPFHLLTRVGELGHCEILEQDLSHVFRIPEEVLQGVMDSSRLMSFRSAFHPFSPFLFSESLERGIEFTGIITASALETLRNECSPGPSLLNTNNSVLNRTLTEYKEEIKNLLNSEDSSFLVYDGNIKPMSMTVTDKVFFLSLLDKKGRLTNRVLMASGPGALRWGEELFMYYKERSRKLSPSGTFL